MTSKKSIASRLKSYLTGSKKQTDEKKKNKNKMDKEIATKKAEVTPPKAKFSILAQNAVEEFKDEVNRGAVH